MNDFNRFGRQWKVFLQAEPEYRTRAGDIGAFYVRNDEGSMVPLSTLVETRDVSLTAREKLALVRMQQECAVAALRESVKMATTRYVSGLSSYFEVLDAQQELYPAEYGLARTRRDEQLAVVALYRALGGGWNADAPEPEISLPLAP